MVLVSASKIAGSVGLEVLRQSRKKSAELFGYDFMRLGQQLIILFAVAWIIEILFKASIFFQDPNNQRTALFGLFGIGGFITNALIKLFEESDQNGGTIPTLPNHEIIQKLFGDGYQIAGFNVTYWDLIKMLAMILIYSEYNSFKELSETTGSKVNETTTVLFGLFIGAMALMIVPKFSGQIQQVVNR